MKQLKVLLNLNEPVHQDGSLVWRRRPFSFYYYYARAKEKGLVKLTYTTCATAHAAIAACQSDCLK